MSQASTTGCFFTSIPHVNICYSRCHTSFQYFHSVSLLTLLHILNLKALPFRSPTSNSTSIYKVHSVFHEAHLSLLTSLILSETNHLNPASHSNCCNFPKTILCIEFTPCLTSFNYLFSKYLFKDFNLILKDLYNLYSVF